MTHVLHSLSSCEIPLLHCIAQNKCIIAKNTKNVIDCTCKHHCEGCNQRSVRFSIRFDLINVVYNNFYLSSAFTLDIRLL